MTEKGFERIVDGVFSASGKSLGIENVSIGKGLITQVIFMKRTNNTTFILYWVSIYKKIKQ